MPACLSCADTGHVCENHPDRPWGAMCCDVGMYESRVCEHGACGCGAGDPCPACCPQGLTSIADAFTPRFTEVR